MFITEQDKTVLYQKKAEGLSFKQVANLLGCNYTLFINAIHGRRELPEKYATSFKDFLKGGN